jgi:hypothetical protein
MGMFDFLNRNFKIAPNTTPRPSRIGVINPDVKSNPNLFPDPLIDKLVFAESGGRPSATAIGSDKNSYKGLMGMGQTAWDEVNQIRKTQGKQTYSFSMAHDAKLNREYGTTYMNERVPQLIDSLDLPKNPLMGLILYGGWFKDMQKAKGDISKMPKSAQTYFRNVLGDGVTMFAPTIRSIYTTKIGSKK